MCDYISACLIVPFKLIFYYQRGVGLPDGVERQRVRPTCGTRPVPAATASTGRRVSARLKSERVSDIC